MFAIASQVSSHIGLGIWSRTWGGAPSSIKSDETCDANVIVIEITSHLCLKPLKQVVQLLAARPAWRMAWLAVMRPTPLTGVHSGAPSEFEMRFALLDDRSSSPPLLLPSAPASDHADQQLADAMGESALEQRINGARRARRNGARWRCYALL